MTQLQPDLIVLVQTMDRWGDPCGGVGKRMYIQMSYGPQNV